MFIAISKKLVTEMNDAVGYISGVEDGYVLLTVPVRNTYFIEKQNITQADVRFDDGRRIRPEQRKKAYAIIGEIAEWSGHTPPELMKDILKNDFLVYSGGEYFSLSDCTVTTAREFINFLIDFCFFHNIPTRDTMLNHTDDISHYLYACLAYRKCCICNEKAEIHHCEGSKVGMGFNRNKIENIGRNAIALCRKHHNQAHGDEKGFFEKFHVYGIKLDKYLVKRLGL